jgi:hypothetical protein
MNDSMILAVARTCISVLTLMLLSCMGSKGTVANEIYVIVPYRHASTWAFDDPAVGLTAEPFVSGIPAMIDILIERIPKAEQGFRLLFSAGPFPGYQVKLSRLRSEYGGSWYQWPETNMEGWLCPALFKYFPEPPSTLYVRAEPV